MNVNRDAAMLQKNAKGADNRKYHICFFGGGKQEKGNKTESFMPSIRHRYNETVAYSGFKSLQANLFYN